MRLSRVALISLLLVAVPMQALATIGCSCESQGHSVDAGMPMAADHMTHDSEGADIEHDKPHSCDGLDAACECSACSQLPAPISVKSDLSLFGAGLNESAIAAYTEPVPIPALRPPISP